MPPPSRVCDCILTSDFVECKNIQAREEKSSFVYI